MRPTCLVLDFDGTFTDVAREAAPFTTAFRDDLAATLGGSSPFDARWEAVEREIRATPSAFGWRYEGHIVAPATADPYTLATTIADVLLERDAGILDPSARAARIQALYHRAYTQSATCFRPEAREVLTKILKDRIPTFVITNARTDMVEKKLAALALEHRSALEVLGDAGKYVITEPREADPRFDRVPVALEVPGLGRPVLLRRGRYFDALRAAWARSGGTPESTLVVGDIFELDLALPSALGAAVHLVTRPGTSESDLSAVATRPRGGASADLFHVLTRLAG